MIRQLILKRITEIKKWHGGFFLKTTMRWQHFEVKGVHINDVKFEELDDETLVTTFERIIKKHNTPM